MKLELRAASFGVQMRVLVDVVYAVGIEGTGTALDAMYLVTLFKKQFSEVGAVLAGDAGD